MPDIRERPDERPSSPDYELAPTVLANTATHLKALGEPTRWTILDLVLERAATTTELAEALDRPKGTVDHHLKVLEKAGLVRVVRTRKVRAITERYWGRTARTIVVDTPAGDGSDDGTYFVQQGLAELRDLPPALLDAEPGFSTLRHARVPRARVEEFVERLEALSVEFASARREGDVVFGMLLAVYPTTSPRLQDSP
jgi:DNA-binding transcriptional ArsR family regulator